MNLEEMKNQWSTLNSSNDNIETSINDKKFDKMKTAQQQLVSQYRAFSAVAGLFALLSYYIFSRFVGNVWIQLGFIVLLFTSAVMDFALQRKVEEIDLGTMTVTEVAQKAAACRRLHHIFQMILIPFLIVLLGFLAYVMTDEKSFIYGMVIGVVIGVTLGLKTYFKMMDNYKSLIKN